MADPSFRPEAYATRLPSGENTGDDAGPSLNVTRVIPPR